MTQNTDFDITLFLPHLLSRAGEKSGQTFERIQKDRYDLSPSDWRVMLHLARYNCRTAQDVSVESGLHKTKVSRAVQRLERRMYLTRGEDALDRRREPLALTTLGQTVFRDLLEVARDCETGLVRQIGAEELDQLRRMLAKLEQSGRERLRT